MPTTQEVRLPDIGDFENVDVIEVLVSAGDQINKEDSLITLESEKATMEVPAPFAGTVKDIKVRVGDKVTQGDVIALVETSEEAGGEQAPAEQPAEPETKREAAAPVAETAPEPPRAARAPQPPPPPPASGTGGAAALPHASPSVRLFARELGVDLTRVRGSGPKGRILKEDVQSFVKGVMQGQQAAPGGGLSLAPMPEVDFSQFGEIETQPLTRIQKISGPNLQRNWVTIPHVTHFDEADVTELEAFRKEQAEKAKEDGVKLTPLAFFMKAVVAALKEFPQFNASLHPDGENLVLKKYFHIGVAVDTPEGLVVPVVRDVDCKSIVDLAKELAETGERARNKKITPKDIQGGCFTISSLGGIGGTNFTPIINAPEVAILGVSRMSTKPVYRDGEFEPRLILPLAVSFDHRVIDGATAARFTRFLAEALSDIRQLVL